MWAPPRLQFGCNSGYGHIPFTVYFHFVTWRKDEDWNLGVTRTVRDNSVTTVSGASTITANIQAAAFYAEESAIRAFHHAVIASCQAQNSFFVTFMSVARMTGEMIEVFPCSKVYNVVVKPLSKCGNRIPVDYKLQDRNGSGYLDPRENVIYKRQIPEDCDLTINFSVTIDGQIFEYNRAGILRNVSGLQPLELHIYRNLAQLHFQTLIFRQMLLHNFDELHRGVTRNDIFRVQLHHTNLMHQMGVINGLVDHQQSESTDSSHIFHFQLFKRLIFLRRRISGFLYVILFFFFCLKLAENVVQEHRVRVTEQECGRYYTLQLFFDENRLGQMNIMKVLLRL